MYGISKADLSLQTESVLPRKHTIYFVAAFLSLVLSYLATLRAAVINPDAICYVQSAAAMKMGLSAAMQVCGQAKWPFFSTLIYGLSSATNLSYVSSAYLLDSFFSLLSVLSFISIARFIKDSPQVLWFAAIVILFAHEFNAVREYIIRDHGFWAFYLVSILCLLHYFKQYQLRYALGWSASLLVATLFRVEGMIFLLLIPWISFLMDQPFKRRVFSFFQLNVLTILAGLIIGLAIIFHSQSNSIHHLGRLDEVSFQVMHGLSEIVRKFNANVQILGDQILNQYARHDAKQVLVLLLIVWFCTSVLSNVSFIYAGLVIYAWTKRCMDTSRQNRLVLWSYLLINVLVTFIFLIENMFLSKRYLLALSLTLMMWVPFGLANLCNAWPKRRFLVVGLVALIFVFSIGGIVDLGYSKRYIRDAGHWLEENVPATASLYSNDEQLLYYSHHYGDDFFVKLKEFSKINIIADKAWNHYDYIAIRMNKRGVSIAELQALGQPIQEFANKRGDKINIYKVH